MNDETNPIKNFADGSIKTHSKLALLKQLFLDESVIGNIIAGLAVTAILAAISFVLEFPLYQLILVSTIALVILMVIFAIRSKNWKRRTILIVITISLCFCSYFITTNTVRCIGRNFVIIVQNMSNNETTTILKPSTRYTIGIKKAFDTSRNNTSQIQCTWSAINTTIEQPDSCESTFETGSIVLPIIIHVSIYQPGCPTSPSDDISLSPESH